VAGLMNAFPPGPEGQVTLANWRNAPFNHWSFHHVRELIPTAEIANDPERVWTLPSAPVATGELRIKSAGKGSLTFEEFLSDTSTDGIVILLRGRIAYEAYGNGMRADNPHILMSVSKSMLGLLAGTLVARGMLDLERMVTDIIPELRDTAYAGATIRQLLDMRAGIAFDEDYLATSGPIVAYRRATGWNPLLPGEPASDLRSFYQTMRERRRAHGGILDYISPNTDLLGWVIERTAGRRYADLMGDMIWKPMGAARSAYITVDRLGAPRCAGGMCVTPLDLARVGQLIVDGGARDGRQIIPSEWISDIMSNGDPAAWAAGTLAQYFPDSQIHYRSKWYVHRAAAPLLMAYGIHGQYLFVDREREIVIAKASSQALPMDPELIALTLEAVDQLRAWLVRH
jgi:hypothetical protein